MPSDTVLSHRSAAAVWGLWIPPFREVEVTTPAGAAGSRYTTAVQRSAVVAHRRMLPAQDVTVRHGLLVTDLARTWLDLGPLLDVYDLVAAGDRASSGYTRRWTRFSGWTVWWPTRGRFSRAALLNCSSGARFKPLTPMSDEFE